MRKFVAVTLMIVAPLTAHVKLTGTALPDPASITPFGSLLPHATPPDPNWFWPSGLPGIPKQDDITRMLPAVPKNWGAPGISAPGEQDLKKGLPNPNDALPWLERPGLGALPPPQTIEKEIPDKNWFMPSIPSAPKPEDLQKQKPDPNWFMPVLPRPVIYV